MPEYNAPAVPWFKEESAPLVLASQSPRRKEILSDYMGITVEVCPGTVQSEHTYFETAPVEKAITTLATAKASSLPSQYAQRVILAADTVVEIDGTVLGKPHDRKHARRMLKQLSGRSHTVITAVAVLHRQRGISLVTTESTEVTFRPLSEYDIERYLSFNLYGDKAGAYGIQGAGALLVASISGCFYNVMGLPPAKTIELLRQYTIQQDTRHEYK
ncbi:Maf family protein [Chitinivibrio alkaliphilus]|uniref:dTTP/UTP pyrophosphatase n=1 Tax=Chitinivibrio alkaliphilus ACht1 TaxID=1313304 RepID=U7DA96_9BACT|nr:Maf family protein [Chitinivibrio alkaliphilus]ERP38947.1 Maf-like protein [Chitinivibrio alkaliphilus ACht1]